MGSGMRSNDLRFRGGARSDLRRPVKLRPGHLARQPRSQQVLVMPHQLKFRGVQEVDTQVPKVSSGMDHASQ